MQSKKKRPLALKRLTEHPELIFKSTDCQITLFVIAKERGNQEITRVTTFLSLKNKIEVL
jgi:hypothetical protein